MAFGEVASRVGASPRASSWSADGERAARVLTPLTALPHPTRGKCCREHPLEKFTTLRGRACGHAQGTARASYDLVVALTLGRHDGAQPAEKVQRGGDALGLPRGRL